MKRAAIKLSLQTIVGLVIGAILLFLLFMVSKPIFALFFN